MRSPPRLPSEGDGRGEGDERGEQEGLDGGEGSDPQTDLLVLHPLTPRPAHTPPCSPAPPCSHVSLCPHPARCPTMTSSSRSCWRRGLTSCPITANSPQVRTNQKPHSFRVVSSVNIVHAHTHSPYVYSLTYSIYNEYNDQMLHYCYISGNQSIQIHALDLLYGWEISGIDL